MALAEREIKFCHTVDRMVRDNFKYVQSCLLCLVEGAVEIIPTIFKTVSDELPILLGGGKSVVATSRFDKTLARPEFKNLVGNLRNVGIVLDLINS